MFYAHHRPLNSGIFVVMGKWGGEFKHIHPVSREGRGTVTMTEYPQAYDRSDPLRHFPVKEFPSGFIVQVPRKSILLDIP